MFNPHLVLLVVVLLLAFDVGRRSVSRRRKRTRTIGTAGFEVEALSKRSSAAKPPLV